MEYSRFVDCFERKSYTAEFLEFVGFKLSSEPLGATALILGGSQAKQARYGDVNALYDAIVQIKLKESLTSLRELDPNAAVKKNKQRKVHQRVVDVFQALTNELRILNKILERSDDSVWLVYPVYTVCHDVSTFLRDTGKYMQLESRKQLWEECIRVIHRSFMICLNDKNPNMQENKRGGCILFANLEMMFYKMLRNRDMMKNLIKVLESTGMTDISRQRDNKVLKRHRSQKIIFNYFIGEYYGCYLFQFNKAQEHLQVCVSEFPVKYTSSKWFKRIIHLYTQFRMLATSNKLIHVELPRETNEKFANAYDSDLMNKCYKNGDTIVFDELIKEHAAQYLIDGTYSAMLLIKELVFLRLVKVCYKVNDKKSILPLDLIAAGYRIHFRNHDNEENRVTTTNPRKLQKKNEDLLDELECRIANLIANGRIKGYLSHSQRCMVLSKTEPFPLVS
ncbi:PCI domain profile [Nakaseomyces glabratus]|nr:PCI domain profile [Nakaseomyces glabratus]KAH7580310.1 PCI domain profile [Nakaseomyces glabratus]KAI8392251.1 PCI domain profile [Nakaseomyces glabratus]